MVKILGNRIDISVQHDFHYVSRFKMVSENHSLNRAIIWPKYEDYLGVDAAEILAKTDKYLRFYRNFPLVPGMHLAPLFRDSNRQYIDSNILQNFSTMAKITQERQSGLVYECCKPKNTCY